MDDHIQNVTGHTVSMDAKLQYNIDMINQINDSKRYWRKKWKKWKDNDGPDIGSDENLLKQFANVPVDNTDLERRHSFAAVKIVSGHTTEFRIQYFMVGAIILATVLGLAFFYAFGIIFAGILYVRLTRNSPDPPGIVKIVAVSSLSWIYVGMHFIQKKIVQSEVKTEQKTDEKLASIRNEITRNEITRNEKTRNEITRNEISTIRNE